MSGHRSVRAALALQLHVWNAPSRTTSPPVSASFNLDRSQAASKSKPDLCRCWSNALSFEPPPGYPEDHPISQQRARELIAGDLGDVYRDMLRMSCSPIYWHSAADGGGRKMDSCGTLTYAKIGSRTFGLTAAHVVEGYQRARESKQCILQIGNAAYDLDLVAIDDGEDLAVLNIPGSLAQAVGKAISYFELMDRTQVPQEGRGIMLAGFPGEDWSEFAPQNICWGLFTAVGIARRVNATQITWVPDHERNVPARGIPSLPQNKNLGGISGGPLIAWFEKRDSGLSYPVLVGIIVQADATLENVIARRLDTAAASRVLSRLF